MREIMARKGPVTYEGKQYQMPFKGEGATGLGKPLKSIMREEKEVEIYTANITPAGIRCAAEKADGFFPIWMDPNRYDVFKEDIDKGFAVAEGDKSLDNFDVAPFVVALMDDNIDGCRWPVKTHMALYIGGMGARDKNFYNDYVSKMGYAEEAKKIQDLYLDGKKDEAAMAIPDELVDKVALVGPEARIRERLQDWKAAGERKEVGSMLVSAMQPEVLEVLADELL